MAIVATAFCPYGNKLFSIRQITNRETWPIRRQVFQPNRALKKNKLNGDVEATHLGAFSSDQLIGVLTWSAVEGVARVRKLAILEQWRRQGVASQLMRSCLIAMVKQGLLRCSLLATGSSVDFYRSIGFEVVNPDVRRGAKCYVQMCLTLAES